MYLDKITIEGYKNFREKFEIIFTNKLNVLVGENGIGKSAIIDAIRLLLLEDEFGRSNISGTEFHRPFSNPTEIAKQFRVNGVFSGLSKNEIVAFLPWTDLSGHASLSLQVDNKANHKGYYKRVLWGGASRSSIFEWELFDGINCIYLPPLRDAEFKLREGKSSRLARLLKNLNKKTLDKARETGTLHPLEKKVKDFNESLSSNSEDPISNANKLIRTRLKDALGSVFGQDTHIQFSESNFSRIVESLRLLFFPGVQSPSISADMYRSLEENSLGYNNLLYLATVLAELTDKSNETEYLKLLLIEEPEAHLHPQLQIRLLKYLEKTSSSENVQVIVTTHSPVLASAVSLDSLIHISSPKKSYPQAVSVGSCGLSTDSIKFISRWMDATKSTLFFAKGIILVEGISEAMLLPVLAKQILREYNSKIGEKLPKLPETLEDGGISVINMNGIYFNHFMPMFCNIDGSSGKTIPIHCSGITDNDPPKKIMDGDNEVPFKPTQSNKIAGKNRALLLKEEVNSSEWVRLFSNDLKTFEYDMAMEGGNMNIMFTVAISLLEKKGAKRKEMERYQEVTWDKETDEEKRAEAAYYLLDHIDKGEFSQKLADMLTCKPFEFSIPKYISDAVIWACGGDLNGTK